MVVGSRRRSSDPVDGRARRMREPAGDPRLAADPALTCGGAPGRTGPGLQCGWRSAHPSLLRPKRGTHGGRMPRRPPTGWRKAGPAQAGGDLAKRRPSRMLTDDPLNDGRRQCWRPPQPNASCPLSREGFARPLTDQPAFVLRRRRHNVGGELTDGCRGVNAEVKADNGPTTALGPLQQRPEVGDRSRQAVELGHDQHVGLPPVEPLQCVDQSRALKALAAEASVFHEFK